MALQVRNKCPFLPGNSAVNFYSHHITQPLLLFSNFLPNIIIAAKLRLLSQLTKIHLSITIVAEKHVITNVFL